MNTTLATHGIWRLRKYESSTPEYSYHYLDHDCGGPKLPDKPSYTSPRYWFEEFKVPCTGCGETPPEGIQALYVLLTGDCCNESWWQNTKGN